MADSNKHTPSLRFPEFLNDGEWKLAHIGRYYRLQGGFAFKSCYFKDSGIAVIRIANIPNDGVFVDTSNCVYHEAITNDSNYIVSRGDLLIAMSGATTGKTAIFKEPHNAYLNQRVGLFKSINVDNYYPFLCQWVKSECFSRQLKRTLAAGAQPNISSKDIESFVWAFPIDSSSNKEQRKIADCLTSLDRYIYNTKDKLERLKEHKCGLMQRLFPAKGKNVPELRFPEFQNDGEWEEHTLSDIFTFIPNNTLSRANLNYENGSVQNIHYGDVLIRFRECLNVQNEELPFISDVQDIERYYKVKLVNGDVIIADTAEDETVGKCTELVGLTNEIIVSGLHTIAIRPNIIFATGYLGFYMNSNSYREQLRQIMQGVKVLSISKTAISQTKLRFPSSISEQEKIARSLSSINDEIKSYEDKISALELHKRGLMQQLFPDLPYETN